MRVLCIVAYFVTDVGPTRLQQSLIFSDHERELLAKLVLNRIGGDNRARKTEFIIPKIVNRY